MKANTNSWLMIVRRSFKKEHLTLLLKVLNALLITLLLLTLWFSNFKEIKTLQTRSLLALSITGLKVVGGLILLTLIGLLQKPKLSIILSLLFLGLFLIFSYPVFDFLVSYAHNNDPFNNFNHGPQVLANLNYELYGLTLIGSLLSMIVWFLQQLPIKFSITRKYKSKHS